MFSENETVAIGNKLMSKVERYGWSVLDEMGELKYIRKTELVVDHSYQRSQLSEKKILRIASNWSWVACSSITVAQRNGKYFIIDGQQRVAAAMKRADITKLPAIVFNLCEVGDEALGFLRINSERKGVKAIEKIKAKLMTGDSIAHRIYEMAEDIGREISNTSDGKSLKCVDTIYTSLKLYKDETEKVWPLIVRLCEGRNIPKKLFQGIVYLQKFGNPPLIGSKFEKRIIDVGYDELIDGCHDALNFFRKGGSKIFAHGIINKINKGLRHKMSLINIVQDKDSNF